MHDTTPASVTLCEWSLRNASRIGLAQHWQHKLERHPARSPESCLHQIGVFCNLLATRKAHIREPLAKGQTLGMAAADHMPIVCESAAKA